MTLRFTTLQVEMLEDHVRQKGKYNLANNKIAFSAYEPTISGIRYIGELRFI